MAQMHTRDAFLPLLQAPPDVPWTSIVFKTAGDEPEIADEDDDDDEDEDEEDDDEDDEEDDDEDEDDEDEDEDDDEVEEEAGPRTVDEQLKRHNGHRWED